MSQVGPLFCRRGQHRGGQIHLPVVARQHVCLFEGLLPPSSPAEIEFERGREVLLDAQQLHSHPHLGKRFFGSIEP